MPERLLRAATTLFAEHGFDGTSVQEIVEAAGVTKGAMYHYFASKEDLLSMSDVTTIHLVLSERTRGLIGASELAMMKPGAVLVNVSRGPIVDEAALLSALSRNRIHAALDVYDREPLPADHPLRIRQRMSKIARLLTSFSIDPRGAWNTAISTPLRRDQSAHFSARCW